MFLSQNNTTNLNLKQTPGWTYQPKLLLHKLSLKKSSIKYRSTFISSQVTILINCKLSSTKRQEKTGYIA